MVRSSAISFETCEVQQQEYHAYDRTSTETCIWRTFHPGSPSRVGGRVRPMPREKRLNSE
eukprot:COSAG06_NODE_67792_length_251_cov_0.638158_1_plen_59_part_10